MRWTLFTLVGLATATAALADVDCGFYSEAYAPTFDSATVDGGDAFIDPTPDSIVAGPNGTILFRYNNEVLVFSAAGDVQ